MRFGFGVNPHDVTDVVDAAVEAERLGFDRIGVWDSPVAHREVWVTLAAAASATRRLRLGTWVTNPITRHPVVTAAAAATLDDIAPGRVTLGVGSGDSGVYNLGGTASNLDQLCAYVTAVGDLLRTGHAWWQDHELTLDWPGPRRIPIYLAAHGPRSLELAGQVADGAVVGTGIQPENVREATELVAKGAAAAGRSLDDLELWWMAPWYVDDDAASARQDAIWHLSSLVHHWSRIRGGTRFPERLRAAILELGSRYYLRTHGAPTAEDKAAYVRTAEELGVADYLLRRFTFSGTPDDVCAQMLAARDAGAHNLDCANPAPIGHVLDRPTRVHGQVLPRLRGHLDQAVRHG